MSDEEYAQWPKEKKARRHLLEIQEAQKMFDALQSLGIDPFVAAEQVPTPRANRRGASQADIRKLYQ